MILYAVLLVCKIPVPGLSKNGVAGFFIKALFTPVTGGAWWFVTVYVIISLIAPLLNSFLRRLNKNGMLFFVLLFWVVWFSISSLGASYYAIERGMFFYVLGAYIRLYRTEPINKGTKIKFVLLFIIMWIIGAIAQHYGMLGSATGVGFASSKMYQVVGSLLCTSIVTPVCAFTMFEIFRSTEIKNNAFINRIAECTFGVYLIHDSMIGRNFIWYSLLKADTVQYNSRLYPLWFVLSVVCLFSVCTLIDMLRLKWVEPVMVKCSGKIIGVLSNKYLKEES